MPLRPAVSANRLTATSSPNVVSVAPKRRMPIPMETAKARSWACPVTS